jgi:hypothetical protein
MDVLRADCNTCLLLDGGEVTTPEVLRLDVREEGTAASSSGSVRESRDIEKSSWMIENHKDR